MNIALASTADLPLLQELFRGANDAPYDLAAVASEKCFGRAWRGDSVTLIAREGEAIAGAIAFSASNIRLIAVARERRREGIGSALLTAALERFEPGARLTAGGEPGNYFVPGVPEKDETTLRFFERRAFRPFEQATDLTADLGLAIPPCDPLVRRARPQQKEQILDYIAREFSPGWAFEVTPAFDLQRPSIFVAEDGGKLAGFSAHEVNNRGLGFYGPAGVTSSLRGRGIGRGLLLASLGDLRRSGRETAVIPWVSSVEFYERSCGARVAQHFLRLRRD